LDNKEVAQFFKLGARLLELYDDNKFKIRSYQNAAYHIEKMEQSLSDLGEEEIEQIEGIGKNIGKKIHQILDIGTYDELQRLTEQTPKSILELLGIKGIGPKKIATAWQALNITTPREFLNAAENGQLNGLKGFGKKTEDKIKEAINYYLASANKCLFAEAEPEINDFINLVRNAGVVKQIEAVGAFRRKCEVIDQAEFQIITDDVEAWKNFLNNCSLIENVTQEPDNHQWQIAQLSIPVVIHTSSNENWYRDLFFNTGASDYTDQFSKLNLQNISNEAAIFNQANQHFIPPEIRESYWSDKDMSPERVEHLITYYDLKGCIHNHSTYSDGTNTLKDMALYCQQMGLEYFGIADHSKAAFYANGLSEAELLRQGKAIDELNEEMAPFKIFKGVESDILTDGSLDYQNAVLDQLDYVVASIHAPLNMDQEKATNRLIKAIENPFTTILGHMTGRLLLMREGYPVDHQKIIEACAANEVVIELNANPRRLDIDWRWIDFALKKGCSIAINPDGHVTHGMEDMYYGVQVARKGGLTKDRVLNALPLEEFEAFLNRRKEKMVS